MRKAWFVAAAAAAVTLSGCSDSADGASDGKLAVVASTNVYGDIIGQIGGDHVDVTSLITGPQVDPHDFDPGTETGLDVSKADLVVVNGAGYDAFMDKLLDATPNDDRRVVDLAEELGVEEGANPHLWYDVPKLPDIATAIGDALAESDPDHAADYHAGAKDFTDSLSELDKTVDRMSKAPGTVAATEPVAAYLVAAAGLTDETPTDFSQAVENESEPSPQAVADFRGLITDHKIDALIYNEQTSGGAASSIKDLAESEGVPVVGVTETLPDSTTFQAWQQAQATDLAAALSK